jgi:hypothetical protein
MRISALLISPALFIAACCLPALEFTKSEGGLNVMLGANILAVGWSGIFAGIPGWYANLFWVLGLVLGFLRKPIGQPWWAAGAGVLGLLIACSAFKMLGQTIPGDEGDVTHLTLVRFLPGFYVWIASLATLPVLVFFNKPKSN